MIRHEVGNSGSQWIGFPRDMASRAWYETFYTLLETGEYRELEAIGITILRQPYEGDDCQSWAFRRLGHEEFCRDYTLRRMHFPLPGFEARKNPQPGDLAVYFNGSEPVHFAIVYDDQRMVCKHNTDGPVMIHPKQAFWEGTDIGYYVPASYSRDFCRTLFCCSRRKNPHGRRAARYCAIQLPTARSDTCSLGQTFVPYSIPARA